MATAKMNDEAYVVGRNGYFSLDSIELRNHNAFVSIHAISKLKREDLHAGFGLIDPERMDKLCIDYLRERGKIVGKPGDDPKRCPECDSEGVEWGNFDYADGEVLRYNWCTVCGCHFTEAHQFVDYEISEHGSKYAEDSDGNKT